MLFSLYIPYKILIVFNFYIFILINKMRLLICLTFVADSVILKQMEQKMKRIIETLNSMSFDLPEGYAVAKDKYDIQNGQGFINNENYLSKDGKVISFFEIHRDPDEFLEYYTSLAEKYNSVTDRYELINQFALKVNDFNFPVFVIKGYREKLMYLVQVFINCGDCMGCFMIYVDKYDSDVKKLINMNPLMKDLVKILRTVE